MASGQNRPWARSYSDGTAHTWSRSFSEKVKGWGLVPFQDRLRVARKKKVQGKDIEVKF